MNDFLNYINCLAQHKLSAGKDKTANNYCCAARALALFLTFEEKPKVLPFSELTPWLVERFEAYLLSERGVRRNTSSAYMRSLQAAWNAAAREGYAVAGVNPFAYVYTGVDKTRHRATDQDSLLQLFSACLDDNPKLAFTRDIFIFSFLCRGMAFVDIAKLHKRDICDGSICYVRSKTGQKLCVRISAAMESIINRWGDPTSPYLLPVVALPFTQCRYNSALRTYNRRLRELTKRLGIDENITSYTARHSWASEAYQLQVPVSVISTCMGHTTESTTRIYLRSLDNKYVDDCAAVVEQYFIR